MRLWPLDHPSCTDAGSRARPDATLSSGRREIKNSLGKAGDCEWAKRRGWARIPAVRDAGKCTLPGMRTTNRTYKSGQSRDQASFLPPCLEDYVGRDNPVRAID